MPELTDILSAEGLAALSAWLREREDLERLIRERGQQKPPPEPPPLIAIAATERTE